MKMAAPRAGAAIINLDRRRSHRLSTACRSRNQLTEPLRRIQRLRQELDLWNEADGSRPMPQPRDLDIPLPDLKPSEIKWRAAR
jgi:hypothetical protein